MITLQQRNRWLGSVALFGILAILGNRSSSIFLYAAVLVCVVQLFFCSEEYNFYFSLFLIPNIRILDGTGINFLVNLIMVLPIVKYLFKHRSIRGDVLLCGVLLFFIELLHIVTFENFGSLPRVICWALSFVYCMTFALSDKVRIDNKKIYLGLTTGILVSAVAYLLCNMDYARNLLSDIFDGERFEAYADDPNYYSLYICLVTALLFSLKEKNKWHYISAILVVVVGLLTASKMCLIVLALILAIGLCLQIAKSTVQGKFARGMVALLAVAVVIFRDYLMKFINNFLQRTGIAGNNDFSMGTLTTGRSVLLEHYFEILSTNVSALLFGAGFAYHNYLGEVSRRGAHNTYLDVLLAWGMLGLIVVVAVVIYFGYNIYKKHGRVRGVIPMLPIMSLMITFLSLSCFSATMFWWVITVAILAGTRENIFEEYINYDEALERNVNG